MKQHNFFKFAVMAFVAVFILSAVPQSAYAQTKKSIKKQEKAFELEKRQAELDLKRAELDAKKSELQKKQARENEYKFKIEEYKREGWKLSGGSRTLEVALLDHYDNVAKFGGETTGMVSKCQSINVCQLSALNNAINNYATKASAQVKAILGTTIKQNDNLPETEISNFVAEYASKVSAELKNVLVESYSVVKENGDGTKSFRTIFFVNEEKSGALRRKAFEQSLLETKIVGLELDEIFKMLQGKVE